MINVIFMLLKYNSGVIFSIVQWFCTCSSVLTMSHLRSLWTSFAYIKENWAHNKLRCLLLSLPLFCFRNFKLARVKRIILIFYCWFLSYCWRDFMEFRAYGLLEEGNLGVFFFFSFHLHVYVSVIVILILNSYDSDLKILP